MFNEKKKPLKKTLNVKQKNRTAAKPLNIKNNKKNLNVIDQSHKLSLKRTMIRISNYQLGLQMLRKNKQKRVRKYGTRRPNSLK